MVARFYDVVVVGAGMGGIYQLHRLLQLGLSVKVIERAGGPGGTWWWNRYPGAMSDTHSVVYRYSWDKEDLQTYAWPHNYLDSEDILTYLNHVVDRYDLRKYMQFNTEVRSLRWNEEDYTWAVETNDVVFTARYVVTALGILSEPNWPSIPGLNSFQGELYHTARWPESYDFTTKKVGVIGNGSTGVQLITTIAPHVGSLLSFQRHPQYSIPAGRRPVSKEERDQINQNYSDIWAKATKSFSGAEIPEARIKAFDVPKDERDRIYQELWDRGGGIGFMLGSFSDLVTDAAANQTACDFMRAKIAEIVKDPEKRRKLTPRDLFARRPLCDTGYYEQFNRDNVDVVDIHSNPIAEITGDGVRLVDGTFHELDVLICATGFNAFDGAYRALHVEGRNGLTLNDHWKDGPRTNMAVASAGFPNLFMVLGPKAPLANVPPMLEAHVDFITSAITHVETDREQREKKRATAAAASSASTTRAPHVAMETTQQGEDDWAALCDALSDKMLFKTVDSYFYGTNVKGKVRSTLIFFGGMGAFAMKLQECIESGYSSFRLQ